jgi:GTPase SAR1 family protein
MNETGHNPNPDDMPGLLERASRLFNEVQRSDLAGRITASATRLRRPDAVLAVAGEFKQGKSSLVNAILGGEHSPVDDDLATAAVAWFRHRPEPVARVHVRREGQRRSEPIRPSQLDEYLSETGNPGNTRGVELVEIGLPNPVLARGISVLDTPGTDGINGAVGRSILSYLPSAHCLIFVSDASAEMNAVELEFLSEASTACPNVILALTKTDLYPDWRRILDLNEGHLAAVGDVPIAPVSSVLRATALQRSDPTLNDESGVPQLMALLRGRVLQNAAEQSIERARTDLDRAAKEVVVSLTTQREALADTVQGRQSMEELQEVRRRLDEVRKAGARWSTVLSDGIADLNQQTDERLRMAFRRLLEEADETLGSQDPADLWEGYAGDLRIAVARLAGEVTDNVVNRASTLAAEVTDRLGAEVGLTKPTGRDYDPDQAGLELPESSYNPFGAILTGLRGGSSGIILLGMIGRLAGLALATPISVGVGVLFGAKQVIDERKRLLEKRRQEARAAARKYLSQAQTDLSAGVREQVRDVQRSLRDEVSERLNELNESYAATIRGLEEGLRRSDEQRRVLIPQLDAQLAELGEILRLNGAGS